MSEERGHSPIGPSGAYRWMACPGSVPLSQLAPQASVGKAAKRGTAAHTVLENCFETEDDPWKYEGMEYEGGELNQEDIEAVEDAISWLDDKVDELRKQYDDIVILKEVDVELTSIHPDLWGALDIVIYSKCLSFIGIYDYKHGSGKSVSPINNPQLLIYLLGAINLVTRNYISTFGWGRVFREMEVGIIQPRLHRKRGPERIWPVEADRLEEFVEELGAAAKATDGSTTYNAGAHCFWCKAQPICPQIYNKKIESAKEDFK